MKIVPIDNLRKDIHFPVIRAMYEPSRNNWFKRMWSFFTYRRKFEVMKDYILWVSSLKAYLFIPNGFIFDGASVPKILNSLYSPTGMLLLGACPHDFGYRYKCLLFVDPVSGKLYINNFNKKELDAVFQELCTIESGMSIAASMAKLGLSIGGFTGWNQNKKQHNILQHDFPSLFAKIEEINDGDCEQRAEI